MSLYAVTCCHMLPEIIAFSLVRGQVTSHRYQLEHPAIDRWIFVNNHFPIHPTATTGWIHTLALAMGGEVITPPRNLGAHGGQNYGIDALRPLSDNDLVLLYDPDSNPITQGWLTAMIEVMQEDKSIGYVSLIDKRILQNRQWKFETVAGHRFASDSKPDMWNVTLFRGKVLQEKGILATHQHYGGVEAAMHMLGYKSGYLYDFHEEKCPIPHDKNYQEWKDLHAAHRFDGTFMDYLRGRA